MLIAHTYYTAGMHELAKVFMESFCHFHVNNAVPLIVEGVGIDERQERELKYAYPFTNVRRHEYRMEGWARECGVPVKTLRDWRKQIEHGYVTQDSRVWKLLTAGGQRVEMVRDTLRGMITPNQDNLLVHFDIDTLFRGSILPLVEEMEGYDVGLKLRPTIQPVKARITIDVMALRADDRTHMWLLDWTNVILETPPMQRPIGFGQSSAWQAYEQAVQAYNLKALTLPLKYGLPGRNKADDVVWCGNVHKLTKDDCAVMFREELARLKEQG